jgi:hypothetical protein
VQNSARLNGAGSKTGPRVVLEGDYVLRTSVKAKAGCNWSMYLDGLESEPLDGFSAIAKSTAFRPLRPAWRDLFRGIA